MTSCLLALFGNNFQIFAASGDCFRSLPSEDEAGDRINEELIARLLDLAKDLDASAADIVLALFQIPENQWPVVLARQNQDGNTLLHWAAWFAEGAMLMFNVAVILSEDQLMELLMINNNDEETPFDWAMECVDPEINFLKIIVQKLFPQQLEMFLVTPNPFNGNVPLHMAADSLNGAALIELVYTNLPNRLFDLLWVPEGEDGHILFHDAANSSYGGACLRAVAGKLLPGQLLSLLKAQREFDKTTPLHDAVNSEYGEEFLLAVEEVLPGQLHTLLKRADRNGATPLHYMIASPYGIAILKMLGKILPRKLSRALKKADKSGKTSLHYAVESPDGAEILGVVGGILPWGQFANLLKKADKNGKTPLHYAVESPGGAEILGVVGGILPSEQFASLLREVDQNGKTPLHYVVESPDGAEILEVVEGILPSGQLASFLRKAVF
ncbi:MAG: hypothetical protein LBF34_03385 [Puniceicoccales bacterium]|jgi:ankyrin repeat protein|nr:hypothetical protein [Puniceicoccales bacterium]